MKWMIASDIHGSRKFGAMLMEAYEKEGAERLLLLGDLLYHGPRNELPDGHGPKGLIPLLNEKKDEILCVRGNCEAEVDQMVLEFPVMSDFLLINEGGLTIFATHGHIYNEERLPASVKGGVLLCGHTHIPRCTVYEDYVYMNPGSVSIPKGGSVNGYMTMEDGVFIWKDIEGNEWDRFVIGKGTI